MESDTIDPVVIADRFVIAKSLGTLFNPVNKKCVPRAVAEETERRKAQDLPAKYAW